MFTPRPSALALIAVLVIGLTATGGPGPVLAAVPAPKCTGWTDEFHPPPSIRVLRSKGPNAGSVEVVDFWWYVAVVTRAEYSTGAAKPPLWMRVGSITVKQYAWYYTMRWRGGKTADGTCYDVKDTTADQIYRPEKWDANTSTWVDGNVPTPAILTAMQETWHITLRKWMPDKLRSRLFLTGYRSGKAFPCGADSTGFKIYQKSLRDCSTKGLTLEEVLRRYYEPRIEIVDVRGRDILADNAEWRGDVGVLSPDGSWRVYPGTADGFSGPRTGSFGNVGTLLGQGAGNVTGDELADLVMLVNNNDKKLLVARATGDGYAAPESQDVPAGTPVERLLVADFDGDGVADVGLLSTPTLGTTKLAVMRRLDTGTFGAPTDWWTGAFDLSATGNWVAAGDVNGDGKADLIMRDGATGDYVVAPSFASCAHFTAIGPCTLIPGLGLDVATMWLDQTGWAGVTLKHTLSDYDRDGRDDVLVLAADNGGIKVSALRSLVEGGFAPAETLWQGSMPLSEVVPLGLHVDPDGLGDLTLLQKDGPTTKVFWLRSIARSTTPASMTPTQGLTDPSLTWSADNQPY